ncbi:MAG: hypothetical protein IJZ35_09010 [Clostridia bacterium]|nr:hypothetical protein [Clostridia bacterium]
MNIEYPSDFEINESIGYICEKGKIKKHGFFVFLRDMTKGLGFANVFYGIMDAMLLTGFAFALLCMLSSAILEPNKQNSAVIASFALAPGVFITMFLLSYIKEKMSMTYSVKMTCKYTVNHLLAYRMFVFSLLGAVADAAYVLLICIKTDLNYITLLCVSLSSLFLFSLVLIFAVLRFNSIFAPVGLLIIWIISNGTLWLFVGDFYGRFLQQIPIWIYIVFAIMAAAVYINRLAAFSDKRRTIYVNG